MKPTILGMAIMLCLPLYAQNTDTGTIYVGLGSGNSDDTPDYAYTIGFIQDTEEEVIWGLDIALEGLRIDKVGGNYYYTPSDQEHGISFNVLGGQQWDIGSDSKFQGLIPLGIRSTATRCTSGQSGLGYQCYADEEPESECKFNFGGMLAFKWDDWTAGLRLTGESRQFVIGKSF